MMNMQSTQTCRKFENLQKWARSRDYTEWNERERSHMTQSGQGILFQHQAQVYTYIIAKPKLKGFVKQDIRFSHTSFNYIHRIIVVF